MTLPSPSTDPPDYFDDDPSATAKAPTKSPPDTLPPLRTAADAPDLIRAFLLAYPDAPNETVVARMQSSYGVVVNNRQVSAVRRGLRPKVDATEELEERYTIEEFRLAKRFLSRLATVERAHALLDAVTETDEEE